MGVLGNVLAAAERVLPGMAYTSVFGANTADYMFRKIITLRLSAEDEKIFTRLLDHKAKQAAGFGAVPAEPVPARAGADPAGLPRSHLGRTSPAATRLRVRRVLPPTWPGQRPHHP